MYSTYILGTFYHLANLLTWVCMEEHTDTAGTHTHTHTHTLLQKQSQ